MHWIKKALMALSIKASSQRLKKYLKSGLTRVKSNLSKASEYLKRVNFMEFYSYRFCYRSLRILAATMAVVTNAIILYSVISPSIDLPINKSAALLSFLSYIPI